MGRNYVFVRFLREADLTTSPSRVPCVFRRQEGRQVQYQAQIMVFAIVAEVTRNFIHHSFKTSTRLRYSTVDNFTGKRQWRCWLKNGHKHRFTGQNLYTKFDKLLDLTS